MTAPSALRAEALGATLPPLLVAAERVAATVAQGVHGRRRVGQGDSFWQFRGYHEGDEVRAIDWRQSARSPRVFVRDREWEAAQSVWLWLDRSASMRWHSDRRLDEKGDRAALLTLALAALLLRGGERVGLFGEDRLARGGRTTLLDLAGRLVRHRPVEPSLPAPDRLPRHASLVLIGDFLAPEAVIEDRLLALAALGVRGHLLQVLDPAECEFPFHGRYRFTGPEGEGSLLLGRAETMAEAYRSRLAAHHAVVDGLAGRLGWTVSRHRTDQPPETALMALYLALGDPEIAP